MNWMIWGFHSEQRQKIFLQNVQTGCGAHPPCVMEVIASSRMMRTRSWPLRSIGGTPSWEQQYNHTLVLSFVIFLSFFFSQPSFNYTYLYQIAVKQTYQSFYIIWRKIQINVNDFIEMLLGDIANKREDCAWTSPYSLVYTWIGVSCPCEVQICLLK